MAKHTGRFRHINKGQVIENGREVEFRIETKAGDFFTVQMEVGQIQIVIEFLEALKFKAEAE
jgi:hypothetical protein